MITQPRQSILLLFMLLAPSVSSQSTPPEHLPPSIRSGMVSSSAYGVVTAPSATLAPTPVLIGDAGAAEGAPGEWSANRFDPGSEEYPDYSLAGMFGPLASVIQLNAVSTGNDIIPDVMSDGSLDLITRERWFALSVSVTNDSQGASGTHTDRVFAGGTDSPGSEIFTYYHEDSLWLAANLPHTVLSERSRKTAGFAAPELTPEERPDITGLDYGLGVIPNDPGARSSPAFRVRDKFFFAVTEACIPALGPTFAIDPSLPWIGGSPQCVPADAATIYQVDWVQESGSFYEWDKPVIYRTPTELGLLLAGDQIDGIAVNFEDGREIFSTDPVTGRDQLLVRQESPLVPAQTLRIDSQLTLSAALGIGTEDDDIDGTCGIDPAGSDDLTTVYGIPVLTYETVPGTDRGLSYARSVAGTPDIDQVTIEINGLADIPGQLMGLFLYAGDASSVGVHPYEPGSTWLQLKSGLIPTGPQSFELEFPLPDPLSSTSPIALMACIWYRDPVDATVKYVSTWASAFLL